MDYEVAFARLGDPDGFSSTRVAERLANELEDSLLGLEHAPEEYVDFVVRVLSSKELAGRAGLEHLVMAVYLDREKLSGVQLDRILACAVNNFGLMTRDGVAFALGDFVARVAPLANALKLLREMATAATSHAALSGVFLGLDILRRGLQSGDSRHRDSLDAVARLAERRHQDLAQA